jgi:hypothetical protein
MENIKSLESEIKGKLENAFDVSHLYAIFSSLVTAINEQNEEIKNLKSELNTTQALCQNLAQNMKTIEYNIQGFDINDELDSGNELKIRDIIDVDPSKGVRYSVQMSGKSSDSRPPTAQKQKETKVRENSLLETKFRENSLVTSPPSRKPSRAEAREKSKSPTDPAELISPALSFSSENLQQNVQKIDLEEPNSEPSPAFEIASPPIEAPHPHRLSQLCGVTPNRTQEQEIAWRQKKKHILQLMFARMNFLITVTNAANISCKCLFSLARPHLPIQSVEV